MTATTPLLPPQFSDLEPFAQLWGKIDDSAARFTQRLNSAHEYNRAFYDAMAPRLEEIYAHIDQFDFNQPLPAPEQALYLTSLGLAEVSMDVELFRGPFPFVPKDYAIRIDWIG
jgi:hypothetical protein